MECVKCHRSLNILFLIAKGEQGTAELGANTVLKQTNELETEASFPYCNWLTKRAGIIWLGSKSVQHVNNWQRFSRLPFFEFM